MLSETGKTRKQLIFRSWHRGTREMDLLLGSFADQNIPALSENELKEYMQILEINDPDLYNWITGQENPPANLVTPLFEKLMQHKYTSSS